MKKIADALLRLIAEARILGLDDRDLNIAEDFLVHHEFGLCFDTLITQMYEYDIEIDNEFYELMSEIAERLELERESYSFMKQLITKKNRISIAVKEELGKKGAVGQGKMQ